MSHRSSAAWLQMLRIRSQAMHRPPSVQSLRQKAAIGAVETMEETTRVRLTELMRLSRTELFAFAARMTAALSEYSEGSYEYAAAHVNLRMRADRNLLSGIKRAGSFKILGQKYSACQLLKISISLTPSRLDFGGAYRERHET